MRFVYLSQSMEYGIDTFIIHCGVWNAYTNLYIYVFYWMEWVKRIIFVNIHFRNFVKYLRMFVVWFRVSKVYDILYKWRQRNVKKGHIQIPAAHKWINELAMEMLKLRRPYKKAYKCGTNTNYRILFCRMEDCNI